MNCSARCSAARRAVRPKIWLRALTTTPPRSRKGQNKSPKKKEYLRTKHQLEIRSRQGFGHTAGLPRTDAEYESRLNMFADTVRPVHGIKDRLPPEPGTTKPIYVFGENTLDMDDEHETAQDEDLDGSGAKLNNLHDVDLDGPEAEFDNAQDAGADASETENIVTHTLRIEGISRESPLPEGAEARTSPSVMFFDEPPAPSNTVSNPETGKFLNSKSKDPNTQNRILGRATKIARREFEKLRLKDERPVRPLPRTVPFPDKKEAGPAGFNAWFAEAKPGEPPKPSSQPYDENVERREQQEQSATPMDPAEKSFKKQRYTFRQVFQSTVFDRFDTVLSRLRAQRLRVEGEKNAFARHARIFREALENAFSLAEDKSTTRNENPLYARLREAFFDPDPKALERQVHHAFLTHMAEARFTPQVKDTISRLLDMRFPHEWFPATRALQRTVHIHVGPTNSGKTYNALKALENAKSGVYSGPLRLLANEIYARLEAKGHACSLITGEEVRVPEHTDKYFVSCTVEMTPLNERFDVAVIDEIQMIADDDRGNAWTTAFLGVQAKEVHLCGEERTVALLQALCAGIGDKCVVHRCERLSPLEIMDRSICNDFNKLEKGDAIVSFSRVSLHMLKKRVEEWTGRRCAIVYGSLPPEVRVQQAALFNDPNNDYDFIVASDAIGMGLNLEIRRVIFETIAKFDGRQRRRLYFPEMKQIGGRAGRYRTAAKAIATGLSASGPAGSDGEAEKTGLVTTLEPGDLRLVQRAFSSHVDNISKASIYPAAGIVERLANFFPEGAPLSYLLMRIKALARVGPRYRLDITRSMLQVADALEDLPLSIHDRLTFCFLPVSMKVKESEQSLRALAKVVAENTSGDLVDIKEIPLEYLDNKLEDFNGRDGEDNSPMAYLASLEALHVTVNQYLWLSFRYSSIFRSQRLALHVRSLVEQRLVEALGQLNFTKGELEMLRRRNRMRAVSYDPKLDETESAEQARDDGDDVDEEEGRESRAWRPPPSVEGSVEGSVG